MATGAADRLLLLLLDGVPYERLRRLHARGLFRRFHAPTRVISTFPTLTDPAYDLLFGTGPTPGYECGYYDRAANRLDPALRSYARGANERWVRACDYRLNFVEDAVMYLFPRGVFDSELRRARRAFERCVRAGRSAIALYILSTDALGHMLTGPEFDRQLARLDEWIENLCETAGGALEVIVTSDHGISALAPEQGPLRRFDVAAVLREGGARVRAPLERRGDVAVPLFGLLDVGRVHAFDDATREQAVAVLRRREEIELVAERVGERVRVYTPGGVAEIDSGTEETSASGALLPATSATGGRRYAYVPVEGDALGLARVIETFRVEGRVDAAGRVSGDDWLAATAGHAFPAAVPRLWDGFFAVAREQPDVVMSLNERWFVGSGLLAGFVRMHGTHGGLHRRVSEALVMGTALDLAGPLDMAGLRRALRPSLERIAADKSRGGAISSA